MYNSDNIKNRFKGSIYQYGFEHMKENDNFDVIAFGNGWSTFDLYMIYVTPSKIEYKYSDGFPMKPDRSKKKIVEYTDNFYIPATIDDFIKFLNE
jgi:hypothetical protein